MTYAQAVEALEALGIMPTSMPSLEPIRRALDRSGLLAKIPPENNVVIAGTNGKGTTAATLSRLISETGQRVGLFTSPHLITTRERIRIDEFDLSEEHFVAAYLRQRERITQEGLTHFEALTLIAADVFFSGHDTPPVRWAIWEVGLGGMFDSTNAIPHRFCAITRIGLDHQAILGNTIEEIACQKLGIIGDGSTVVTSPAPPELSSLYRKAMLERRCDWQGAKPVSLEGLNRLRTPWGPATLSLCGERAAENTATALTLFEAMGMDPCRHLSALARVRWPGRFSQLPQGRFVCPAYVSGDHNVQGAQSLVQILETLGQEHPWRTLHLVVGISKDKQAREMIDRLSAIPRAQLYLTETPFKSLRLDEFPEPYLSECRRANRTDPSVARVLERLRPEPEDLVVVTGSLYLVGQVLQLSADASKQSAGLPPQAR